MLACAQPSAPIAQSKPIEDPSAKASRVAIERVCAHNYEILIVPSGVGSPAVRVDFMARCVVGTRRNREQIGTIVWDQRAKCVLAGQTPVELAHCNGREPSIVAVHDDDDDPNADGVSASLLCAHIIEVMDKEFGGLVPATKLPKFTDDCVDQLEQARSTDPIKFEGQARCMLSTTSLDELDRCSQV